MTQRIDRRRFVWLCLGTAASASLVLTGCSGGEVAAEEVITSPTSAPAATVAAASVPRRQTVSSCPRRLVNDPYPGRCRLYVDKDGDGICDLSQSA